MKLIERVPTNYIPITSESFTPEATLTHVVPHITNSVIYYPTNGNDIDDITFPIRFIRTLISGEYSVLPIEGSTIYLGYPIESSTSLRYSGIRLARPLRTKRRRPRSKPKQQRVPHMLVVPRKLNHYPGLILGLHPGLMMKLNKVWVYGAALMSKHH